MKLNKKGSVMDIFVWIILSFILVVFFSAFMYAFNLATNEIMDAGRNAVTANASVINITETAEETFGEINEGFQVWNWAIGAIIISLGLSIFVSNFLIRVHPVFIIPYVLIVIIAVIFSVYVSNAYETSISGNEVIGQTVGEIKGANFIFLNLPFFTTIFGLLGGLMLFLGIIRDAEAGGSLQ